METKIAEYLTKLMLDDEEDDIVYFAFPNEKRKIKCSISMLVDTSPVFEAMFSDRWRQGIEEKTQLDLQGGSNLSEKMDAKGKTIQLSDEVNFDEYLTFRLLMQIIYGLRKIDTLNVDEATGVYFYSHKYQIKDIEDKIQKHLNARMEAGISNAPLTVVDLTKAIEFAHLYHLDGFKEKLNRVKLAFDKDNAIQFWELTEKFKMERLKEQVLDHMKTIPPNKDWKPDALVAVVKRFQADCLKRQRYMTVMKNTD